MSFRDSIPFLQPRKCTYKVNGVDVTIYALPVSIIYELKTVVRPLARAITILSDANANDVGRQFINFKDNSGDDLETTGQTNQDAISIPLAELRERQKNQAIDNIVDAITSDANRHLLGKLLCTSIKDCFDEYPIPNDDITEFMDTIDIGSMVELCEGIFKINSGAFSPLWERVRQSIKERWIPTQTKSPTKDEQETTEKEKTPDQVIETLG